MRVPAEFIRDRRRPFATLSVWEVKLGRLWCRHLLSGGPAAAHVARSSNSDAGSSGERNAVRYMLCCRPLRGSRKEPREDPGPELRGEPGGTGPRVGGSLLG